MVDIIVTFKSYIVNVTLATVIKRNDQLCFAIYDLISIKYIYIAVHSHMAMSI